MAQTLSCARNCGAVASVARCLPRPLASAVEEEEAALRRRIKTWYSVIKHECGTISLNRRINQSLVQYH